MGIALSQTECSTLIRLEGAIDISVAAELKAVIEKAMEAANAIQISVEAVSDFDVTAFQLLWAAGREAKRLGMNLEFSGQVPEPMRATLQELGLGACQLIE